MSLQTSSSHGLSLPSTLTLEQMLTYRQQLAEELRKRQDENKLAHYRPYTKQLEFHAAGLDHRERLFMAGNQLGKTLAGGMEMAAHLTGLYDDWWPGYRFDRPIRAWAGSKTSEVTRDGVQRMLVGDPKQQELWGTGTIPKKNLGGHSRRTGVADALDGILVQHVTGGWSTLGFKSYDQGREKWQAETLDLVWYDEEPPADIYYEGLTRTNATGGRVYMTFTPLLGMSEIVRQFLADASGNV